MRTGVVGDIQGLAIEREGGADVADGLTAFGVAGPEELAGLAIHALHPFGPMVAADHKVRAARANAVKENHARAAQAAVVRRTRRALLPADGVEESTVEAARRHDVVRSPSVADILLLHGPFRGLCRKREEAARNTSKQNWFENVHGSFLPKTKRAFLARPQNRG